MKYVLLLLFSMLTAGFSCAGPVVNVDSLARNQRIVLDVSHHQGVIDFEKIAQSVRWIYVKASEGCSHEDERFLYNVQSAQAAGIKVGAYHFFSERSGAIAQAQHFLRIIAQVELELTPVLDIETNDLLSGDQLRDSVKVFLNCVEKALGCKPMIYSGEKFFTEKLQQAFGDSYPLWIAKYSNGGKKAPDVGADIVLWQFSESGSIDGVSTAISVSTFMGNHRPRDIKLPSKAKSSKGDGKEPSKSGKKGKHKREKKH